MRQQSLPILYFPGPQVTINQLSVSGDLSVLHMSYKGIIEQMVFQIWLLSLSIVVSQFICITACISTQFFLLPNNIALDEHTTFLLICLSVDGHLGCFRLLAIMKNVPMDIHVQDFLLIYVFISLGYIYLELESLHHMITVCLTF